MSTTAQIPYVLWLTSWYPCRLTPYDGDFIQRHARAVAPFFPVQVLHFIRDKTGEISKNVVIETKSEGNLKETIVYYYSPVFPFPLADRIVSFLKFRSLYKKIVSEYFQHQGLPVLVHVHITFKAGLIARWIKKHTGINYLLTEQWTIFLEKAKPCFKDLPFYIQYLIGKIISGASLVLPVSNYLANTLQRRWPSLQYEVVPNVVDTTIFFPEGKPDSKSLRFIHISTLSYQKDPETLFSAFGIVNRRGIDFVLDLVGPVKDELYQFIQTEGIGEKINFLGEMPQAMLAQVLKKADALILYSRYETFGCVLIEANACGIPVLVPNIRPMNELIQDGVNGILVNPGSASALAEAIIQFSQSKDRFIKMKIAESTAEKYNYNRIGKKIAGIYSRYISS